MHTNTKTNPSYWLKSEDTKRFPKWNGQSDYDVAVIGGGITGLTTALLLKEAGKKVAVLERRHIGNGATAGTTGHLTAQIDYDYMELEKNFGKDGNRLAAKAMSEGIDIIELISKKYNIDCDFTRLPAYYYTEKKEDIEDIEKEFCSSTEAGLKCTILDKAPLPFTTLKALKIENQGQFHSLKYINGLAAAIEGGGSNIFEDTPVTNYEDGEPCTVHINDQQKLEVKDIVVATHTAIGLHILNTLVAPYRSYAMAVKINGEYPRALFWDTEDPYFYIRSQPAEPNGKDEQVLLVGGCDHRTANTSDENEHYQKLEKYIRDRFQVQSIHSQWSSQFYQSVDGLPYIGRSHNKNHIFIATGFWGDGLPWASISAKINSDLILGLNNEYTKLVEPTRVKPIASAKEFIVENASVAKGYATGWLTAESKDIEAMKPGEARVVQAGIKKVAIYKDEEGCVHKMSAVCPHLKSIVKWNHSEKTWDCPSHGGRFTCTGKILEGPPMHDLEDLSDLKI